MSDVPDFSTMDDGAINDYVQQHYPTYVWLMNVPEVGDIIRNAARQGLTTPELESQIQATSWYQTTTTTARQWAELTQSDPATANQKLADRKVQIEALSREAGLGLADDQITYEAFVSLNYGWSDLELRHNLLQAATQRTTEQGGIGGSGSIAASAASIKALAAQYLLPLSDQQADMYAADLWTGSVTLDTIKGTFTAQAAHTYGANNPQFADALSRGVTPRAFIDPLMQAVASTLEMGVDQINPLDPKWSALLSKDDGKGGTRLMTVPEAQLFARQQTAYRYTDQANQTTDQRISALAQTMGEVKF